jgi:hypothetical protein
MEIKEKLINSTIKICYGQTSVAQTTISQLQNFISLTIFRGEISIVRLD